MPKWFPYIDLACAALAGTAWMLRPELGFWPLLVGLAPWAARWAITGSPGNRTAFDLPLAIFLITAAISVWSAFDRNGAWAKFWLIVGAILLFYSFANWAADGVRGTAYQQAWILALLGAATALYFGITHDWDAYGAKIRTLTEIGRLLQSPLPSIPVENFHPNVMGGILAMLAPFAGATSYLAWNRRHWLELTLALIILLLILFALILTMARGAWLALAVASTLAVWWFVTGWLSKNKPKERRIWFFAVPSAILLIALLIFIIWPAGVQTLIASLPASDSGMGRFEVYVNSLVLASDYPIIGAGLDSFMMLFSSYSLLTHVGFLTHGHNLYLDVVIEQGLIALLALIWMWLLMGEAIWRGSILRRSYRSRQGKPAGDNDTEQPLAKSRGSSPRIRRRKSSSRLIVLGAAAMSLLVLLMHGLLDDAIYNSRAILIFFLPLAFAVPVLKRAAVPSRRQQLQIVGLAFLVTMIAVIIWWRPLLSIVNSNLATVAQSQAELSVYRWPDYPIQDAVRQEVDLSTSITGFERALRFNPSNSSANRRLGQIELSLGEFDDALNHLETAYRASPADNVTRQLLGEALILNGRVNEGAAFWATVNNEQGQLAIRQWWYENIGDAEQVTRIRGVIESQLQ